MLTPFDDFPSTPRPTPSPIRPLVTPTNYDRYWFNGQHTEGCFFLAAADSY